MTSAQEVLRRAGELTGQNRGFVLATVVNVTRPASTRRGDKGLVTESGELVGWVGGACSEPIVIREALRALADGLRRQGGRLSLGRQVDRAPVRQVCLSGARLFAGQDALQVRRLGAVDHEQHQPPCADVPVGPARVRRQPVDLVRGRGEIRRRDPAGLHQFRAGRHQRMGGARRLRPSRPAAAQSPRHRVPGAGDRAARRIEIGLLDLQRDLQAARARQLLLGRRQRDRLGQAAVRRLRPAQGDLVEGVPPQGLLRGAGREGEAARAGVVPLVLGEPQEGCAGRPSAAVRL